MEGVWELSLSLSLNSSVFLKLFQNKVYQEQRTHNKHSPVPPLVPSSAVLSSLCCPWVLHVSNSTVRTSLESRHCYHILSLQPLPPELPLPLCIYKLLPPLAFLMLTHVSLD